MPFVYVDITVCILSFELLNQATDLFETLYECCVIIGLLNVVRENVVAVNSELSELGKLNLIWK